MRVILDNITKIVIFIACLAMVILVSLTGYQVWGRYVLNSSPTWAERTALLLTFFIALPVGAVGIRENFHISVTAFTDILSPKYKLICQWLVLVLLWIFALCMTIYSFQLANLTAGRMIPLLGVSQAFQYIPLVLCGGLMLIFLTESLVNLAMGKNNK